MNARGARTSAGFRCAPAALAVLLALAATHADAQSDTHKGAHAAVRAKPDGGTPGAADAGALLADGVIAHANGEQIFRHVCQGCHMPDAAGAHGAAAYPALAADPRLASARYAAATVLFGRRNMPSFSMETDLTGFDAMMPGCPDDAQIADVINYVRSHFGNHYGDPLGAAEVKAMHPRKASP